MGLLGALVAIAAVGTAGQIGLGIAGATRKPPTPPAVPPPNITDPNDASRLFLSRERLRRGRRSTILTGASTLLEPLETAAGSASLLGESGSP